MAYISYAFFGFVFLTAIAYFALPLKARPYVLLTANIVFYTFSGYKNLIYLIGLILVTYLFGYLLTRAKKKRKLILILYLLLSVGSLVFIKFSNYVLGGIARLFELQKITLDVLVPLGISFFTLQGISYAADIYRGKYEWEKGFLRFSLFMSYFPIIVQGPISRYDALASQLGEGHRFDYTRVKFGLQLALWGMFKKLVIANRAAMFADPIFNNYTEYHGIVIIIAVLLYTVQIYADFSGCVDLCRGVSQIFGIELMNNFDHPYFAVSIKDFWSRWHISLSRWLRDYVYIPLGGNRRGKVRKYINLLLTFTVSGLWHGVGIHYLAWGAYHGGIQIIGEVTSPLKRKAEKALKVNTECKSYKLGKQIITFLLVSYGWLLFRANGFVAAMKMTASVFEDFFCFGDVWSLFIKDINFALLLLSVTVLYIISRKQTQLKLREALSEQNLWFRWVFYLAAIFSVIIFGVYGSGYNASDFLYMQF